MAKKNNIEIRITAIEKNLDKVTRDVSRGFKEMRRRTDNLSKGFMGLRKHSMNLGKGFLSLKNIAITAFTAISAYGGISLAKGFIQTASSVETLKIQLDTITKGRGLEWFEKLNEWALKMPVDTQGAIEAFKNLRAMGLDFEKMGLDTIKVMTTLVDTTSALGGGTDVLGGIVRALGQMFTKGKVSSEEMLQLAERGIDSFGILREKMNLTQEALGNIGNAGIDVNKAIMALIEGMQERFGGASETMQEAGKGLWTSLISYFKEFQRLVMESGVWDRIKTGLSAIISRIDEMKKTGDLNEWADRVSTAINKVFDTATKTANAIKDIGEFLTKIGVGETLFETKEEEFLRKIKDIETEIAQLESWEPNIVNKIFGNEKDWDRINQLYQQLADLGHQYATYKNEMAMKTAEAAQKQKEETDAVKQGAKEQQKQADAAKEASGYIVMIDEHGQEIVLSIDQAADKTAILAREAEAAAGSYSRMAAAAEKVAQTNSATAGGMRWGGLVLHRQTGGFIPGGYGGGDKIPGLLEPGEYVLRKEATRALGTGFLDALNRGGGERGFFTHEFRLGGEVHSLQIMNDADTVESFVRGLRRYTMTRG